MRDVTLRAIVEEIVGDETYEVWLKHAGSWSLFATGDVDVEDDHQDFLLAGLTDGDAYVAQIRYTREGRYRIGYLTADPDTWPAASRCEFIPGELEGVGAPTITSAVWSRTSSSAQKITVAVTPDDTNVDLVLYRDGVQVATATAPHTGSVNLVDDNPPVGESHNYIAYHVQGFLTGPASDDVDVFAGLTPLTGLTNEAPLTQFYAYDLSWDDPDGADVQIQDDYAANGVFVNAATATVADPGTSAHETVQKNSGMSANGNDHIAFTARARRTQTLFSPTVDVSDWTEVAVECDIAPDETAVDPTHIV